MTKAVSGFVLLSLVACGPAMRDDEMDAGAGSGSGSGSGTGSGTGEARQCDKMDIVFVVDNSGSMEEEQQNLATNFPMFAQLLKTYTVSNGQPLDFRIAVTTTGRDVNYQIDLGSGFGEHDLEQRRATEIARDVQFVHQAVEGYVLMRVSA